MKDVNPELLRGKPEPQTITPVLARLGRVLAVIVTPQPHGFARPTIVNETG